MNRIQSELSPTMNLQVEGDGQTAIESHLIVAPGNRRNMRLSDLVDARLVRRVRNGDPYANKHDACRPEFHERRDRGTLSAKT